MWDVQGKPVQGTWLDLTPIKILYEFDGPRIFVCKDTKGDLFLAYQCGEENGLLRYLIVPFSDSMEYMLTTGEMNIHDALMRPLAWVFDIDHQWNQVRSWEVQVENLPKKCIPQAGVMLWAHLPSRLKNDLERKGPRIE